MADELGVSEQIEVFSETLTKHIFTCSETTIGSAFSAIIA